MQAMDMLKAVCEDVERITKIKTVIYDEQRRVIHAQPGTMCEFCREVRRSPALAEKCKRCDEYGFSGCTPGREFHIYQCHMGLMEAVAPVMEGALAVGYLMLGQILPENGRALVKERVLALGEEVDGEVLINALEQMSETDEVHLRATARILAMSAAYVRLHQWMKQRKKNVGYEIECYVREHLAEEELSVESVGQALGFSRTVLYHTAKKSFGMGLGDYLRKCRAEEAVRLLRTEKLPLSLVAQQVGLASAAQLTRLLKAQTGKTAKQIRAWQEGQRK